MNKLEQDLVRNTYNAIAESFNHTRYSIWNCVKEFIKDLDPAKPILDAGCGNGKNMCYLSMNGFENVTGCDFSTSLVDICKSKSLNVIEANILSLPFEDNSFENVINVAVLHHLSTKENRIQAIKELLRVTKEEGKIFISVSSIEEPFYKNYKQIDTDCDTGADTIVGWENKNDRYYHLFEKGELEGLINDLQVSIISSFECGNHIVVIGKLFRTI